MIKGGISAVRCQVKGKITVAKPKKTEAPPATDNASDQPVAGKDIVQFTSKINSITLTDGRVLKLKKMVSQSVLRHPQNSTVVITPTGPTYEGKAIEKTKMAPATLVPVIDVLGKRETVYIVPAVLLSEWNDNYKNNSFIGKTFSIYKGVKGEGKRYVDLEIAEVELA